MDVVYVDQFKGDLYSKRVLVRVDFNVPLKEGKVVDRTRLNAAVPTITYLLEKGARVILMSHLGRPRGKHVAALSLESVSKVLEECLGVPVQFASDVIGERARSAVDRLRPGEVMLLENLRFYAEETANDVDFSKALAELGELFIQDAFGAVHRAHASTVGVASYLPAYAGLLIKREVSVLGRCLERPKRPFVALIGGSKISSKFGVLKNLLGVVDTLVIGGAMTFTLLKAMGVAIGNSLYEPEKIDEAVTFLAEAERSKTNLLLPIDHVISSECSESSRAEPCDDIAIPDGKMGLDIGPKTVAKIQHALADAETIIWNGPVGVFEFPAFSKGTFSIANQLATATAITIIGGGDSAAAIAKAGVSDKMTHVSTGGGASLEFLEGKDLPGLSVLKGEAHLSTT